MHLQTLICKLVYLGHNSTHNMIGTHADTSHSQLLIKLSQCLVSEGAVGAGDEWRVFLKIRHLYPQKQIVFSTLGRANSACWYGEGHGVLRGCFLMQTLDVGKNELLL